MTKADWRAMAKHLETALHYIDKAVERSDGVTWVDMGALRAQVCALLNRAIDRRDAA